MLLALMRTEAWMQQRQGGTRERRLSRWVIAATLLLAAASGLTAAPRADESSTTYPSIRDQQPLRQYRAYRRMHARSEHLGHEAWLEAWTELDGQKFTYEIVSEKGSEYIRNKIFKVVLKREQELVADGAGSRSDLTPENYAFEDATSGDGERYVTLKPKRKDVLLVDGRMVLNQDGTELLRVEGRLAKNPSFWTSLVNVIRHYARIDGVQVPISTESTAKVKFAGVSTLDVHYDYETINGRPVSMAAHRALPNLR
jgi:hypothetical protein